MKTMIKSFEQYVKKGIGSECGKTKMVVFRKKVRAITQIERIFKKRSGKRTK